MAGGGDRDRPRHRALARLKVEALVEAKSQAETDDVRSVLHAALVIADAESKAAAGAVLRAKAAAEAAELMDSAARTRWARAEKEREESLNSSPLG